MAKDIIEKIKKCSGCARRREWMAKQKEKALKRMQRAKDAKKPE